MVMRLIFSFIFHCVWYYWNKLQRKVTQDPSQGWVAFFLGSRGHRFAWGREPWDGIQPPCLLQEAGDVPGTVPPSGTDFAGPALPTTSAGWSVALTRTDRVLTLGRFAKIQASIGVWSWVICWNVCQSQDSRQHQPGSSLLPESSTSLSRSLGCHIENSSPIKVRWDYYQKQFLFGK